MSILKKNLMYFQVKLGIFAILHFSPFYYKCAECALVVRPQNVAAVSGEGVILNCTSDVDKENIAWSIVNPGSSEKEPIYFGGLASKVSSYINVYEKDDGSCNLHINASLIAAKRYICQDRKTGNTSSAELIVLERKPQCTSLLTDESVIITCFVKFAGNWAPTMEWKTNDNQKLEAKLDSSRDDVVASALFLPLKLTKDPAYKINVIPKFSESGRPKETTATNVPEYTHTISPFPSAYHYTTEDHTATIPEGCRFHPDGVVASITLTVLVVVVAGTGTVVYFVSIRMKKSHEAKKVRSDEDGL